MLGTEGANKVFSPRIFINGNKHEPSLYKCVF